MGLVQVSYLAGRSTLGERLLEGMNASTRLDLEVV